jgi:hypothetical protein
MPPCPRTSVNKFIGLILLWSQCAWAGFTVTATRHDLIFTFDSKSANRSIVESAPGIQLTLATNAAARKLVIPRFDGARDRIYSRFEADGTTRFAEFDGRISAHDDPYPHLRSKKGLQVQMVDDAIALGVKHAAFNIDIGSSVALQPRPGDFTFAMDGREYHFNRGYIESIDQQARAMSTAGADVTLILLDYVHPGSAANDILQHPGYNTNCPGHISEFNTKTPEGAAWLKAWVEFLADRYTAPPYPHGRVVNFIVGNEVNAHWDWANMGHVPMETFARDYSGVVRLCATAVRKYSSGARVFISLQHDWNNRYAETNDLQGFAGRAFIDYFNKIGKAEGDFEWNLAFHPYPEDLFKCATWKDKSAIFAEDSPRITFKNIEELPRYFRRKEMLYHGRARRIILSEQGFHADSTPKGERLQAAAYCYAWRKIVNLDGIDSFILHRQVDNGGEGGLNLGLWRREPDSAATPSSKRPIYEVFRVADTPDWKKTFEFALPIIGIKSWKEIER